jgi:hypothetical protein
MKKILSLLGCLSFFSCANANDNYEELAYKVLIPAAKSVAKTYELKLLSVGLGSSIAEDNARMPWGIRFMGEQKLTLEEGKIFGTKIATFFLSTIEKNPNCMNYYITREKYFNPKKTPAPTESVSENSLALKIAFWDKNVDRYPHPYLAEIRLINSHLYFYYTNPETQALEEPIIEKLDYTWTSPK